MNVITTVHSDFAVVSITGRLTASGAPLLRAEVRDIIDAGNVRIVVNLADTDFIDSSGLGALIGGLKSARLAGGDLRIAAVPEKVNAVLRLTNLDRVLRSHQTPESAFDER